MRDSPPRTAFIQHVVDCRYFFIFIRVVDVQGWCWPALYQFRWRQPARNVSACNVHPTISLIFLLPVVPYSSVNADNQNRGNKALSVHVTRYRYVQKAIGGIVRRVKISDLQPLTVLTSYSSVQRMNGHNRMCWRPRWCLLPGATSAWLSACGHNYYRSFYEWLSASGTVRHGEWEPWSTSFSPFDDLFWFGDWSDHKIWAGFPLSDLFSYLVIWQWSANLCFSQPYGNKITWEIIQLKKLLIISLNYFLEK